MPAQTKQDKTPANGLEQNKAQAELIRHDWTQEQVQTLFALPFNDLLFQAHYIHRQFFNPNQVQLCRLLSIKTGGCPEDCGYCSQSAHAKTGLQASKLMSVDAVLETATKAKQEGATRYCMGAAWRNLKDRDMAALKEMIKGVRALGLESCATLGMLTQQQADELAEAGLDYYNHNIDTSKEFYDKIITTRTFQDRLDTLEAVRKSGMKICCGGIIGMGESVADRANMLRILANLPQHPDSVPINQLIAVAGTALENAPLPNPIEFVRCIAVARILMPRASVRLSAGREEMSDEMQALCFFAGANSIFVGDELLTKANPAQEKDKALLDQLGMTGLAAFEEPAIA
ncbi:MAG: biotin synthase BioB [Alphaproteobacteria bacterium]|nr:biotin synthase BioB [Alphaproteobacteria bacterium]